MSSSGSSVTSLMFARSKDACASNPQPSPPPAPPPRPPVAPNGDVALLVGPEAHEIRVHSFVLAMASPVFAIMLRSEKTSLYAESAAVRAASDAEPAHVALPDDDPAAMEVVCRVVHCRILREECVWDMTPSEILSVAVVVDKYDCADAMALAVGHWLAPGKLEGMRTAIRDGRLGLGRCDLLLASYWLRSGDVFERVTEMMIEEVAGGFEGLAEGREGREGVDEQLAYKLALALETKRNHLRLALQITLTERIHMPAWNDVFRVTPPSSSFWRRRPRIRRPPRPEHEPASNVLRTIDHEVFSRGMPYMSISEALRRAAEIPAAGRDRTFSLGRLFRGELDAGGEVPWHKWWMARGVTEFREKRMEGLCLACLHPQMSPSMVRHPLRGNVASDPVPDVPGRRLPPLNVNLPLHAYPFLRAVLTSRRRSPILHVQLLRRSPPQAITKTQYGRMLEAEKMR